MKKPGGRSGMKPDPPFRTIQNRKLEQLLSVLPR